MMYRNAEEQIAEEWKNIPEHCYGIPKEHRIGPCVFGCDLRPGVFDLCIADSIKGTSESVFRPIFLGKVQNPVQVMAVVRYYRPIMGIVDIRPDFTSTREFQLKMQDWGIECWRVQYPTNPDDPTEEHKDEEEGILTLHRSWSLDRVWSSFRSGHGVCLPQNFKDIANGLWAKEMCGATRGFTMHRGKMVLMWKKKAEHDDALHAMNYALQSWYMAGLDSGSRTGMVGPYMVDRESLFGAHNPSGTPEGGYTSESDGDFYEA